MKSAGHVQSSCLQASATWLLQELGEAPLRVERLADLPVLPEAREGRAGAPYLVREVLFASDAPARGDAPSEERVGRGLRQRQLARGHVRGRGLVVGDYVAGVARVLRVGVHVHDRHAAEDAREVHRVRLAAFDYAARRTPLADDVRERAGRALQLDLDDAPPVRGGAVHDSGELVDVRADVEVRYVEYGVHRGVFYHISRLRGARGIMI